MNPEQWLSLKWNGGSTMSDRWLNQSKIIHYSIAETAKANDLKSYEYFEYLLTEIPKHMEDTDLSFAQIRAIVRLQ